MKNFLRIFGLLAVLFSAQFLAIGWEDTIISLKTPVDIYEDYPAEVKRFTAVDTEIYCVLDTFGSMTTTTKQNGAITGSRTSYYYIIPVFTEDETYYIAVRVSSENRARYEKVCKETWAYLAGESNTLGGGTVVPIEGGIGKLSKKLYTHMVEWFEKEQYFDSEEELNKYVLPLVLEPMDLDYVRIVSLICAGVFLLGILLLLLSISMAKKEKKMRSKMVTPCNSAIIINGVSYPINNFEIVEKCMAKGDTQGAVKNIQEIAGVSPAQAREMADNWHDYYK